MKKYSKLITEELNKKEDYNNMCLISKEPLDDLSITLACGHKFNYKCLYDELFTNKTKKYCIKNTSNKIICPYCRKIQIGLIPYLPFNNIKKIHGINHPKHLVLNNNKCDWIFKTGKNKGKKCDKSCYYNKCTTHLFKEYNYIFNVNNKNITYLNKLTIPQLKIICKKNNIKGFSKLKKKEIINLIIDN